MSEKLKTYLVLMVVLIVFCAGLFFVLESRANRAAGEFAERERNILANVEVLDSIIQVGRQRSDSLQMELDQLYPVIDSLKIESHNLRSVARTAAINAINSANAVEYNETDSVIVQLLIDAYARRNGSRN